MKKILLLLSSGYLLSGCATIFSGTDQAMQVSVQNKGASANEAVCSITSPDGKQVQQITAPGIAMVERTSKPIVVSCSSKDGVYKGSAVVDSHYNSTNMWNLGLVIPWVVPGAVGYAVDGISGADMEYPKAVTIQMKAATGDSSSETVNLISK